MKGPTPSRLSTVVVPSLGMWAEDWDELVDALPLPSPFLRSWWLGHVAEGDPHFVLALDGEVLVGGAAFQVTVRRGAEAVGMLGDGPLAPDHLDLVAQPGRVHEVVDVLRRWFRRPGSRVIDLVGLVDEAWILGAMPPGSIVYPHEVAPFAPLPPDWADYLAGRPGQVRSTITRGTKRLGKAGIVARRRELSEPALVDSALDDLYRLHDARWGSGSAVLDSWAGFAAALWAGAPSGEVRVTDLVDAEGEVVAIELELCVGRRVAFYQAGRIESHDLRGSGTVLKAAVIRDAIDNGALEFDLLRGNEAYKAEWASAQRRLLRAIGGVGARGIGVAASIDAKRRYRLARRFLQTNLAGRGDG